MKNRVKHTNKKVLDHRILKLIYSLSSIILITGFILILTFFIGNNIKENKPVESKPNYIYNVDVLEEK